MIKRITKKKKIKRNENLSNFEVFFPSLIHPNNHTFKTTITTHNMFFPAANWPLSPNTCMQFCRCLNNYSFHWRQFDLFNNQPLSPRPSSSRIRWAVVLKIAAKFTSRRSVGHQLPYSNEHNHSQNK